MTAVTPLKIRGIRARPVNVPFRQPHMTAGGVVTSAPLVLIDLLTEQGVTGTSYVFCYTPLAVGPVAALIENLAPMLKGDAVVPLAIEQKLQKRFRLLGPQGLTGIAMAGIDMAAWDALARSVGLPLCRLLGGEPRPVPAYHSLGMGGAEAAARDAGESRELGFNTVKFKVGYPEVAGDAEVVRAARRAAGDTLGVLVDYNQSLSVPEALARSRVLDDENLIWIEEPVLADDFAGHAEIRSASHTPIQMGENWWGPHDMAKALSAGSSDLVMLDVMKIGGVSGWLRAAALAEAKGLQVSSHLFPEISAHLLVATPTVHWLEYQDWVDPILQEPGKPRDGYITPSSSPGCGLDWDESAVSKYIVR